MPPLPNSIEARDIAFHLHPYTNARRHEEIGPIVMAKGDGVYVEDVDGKRYIEAMAGLWSVAVGFSEKRLVEAASRQMAELPYYHAFTHKTHAPVVDLAEKLIQLAPVPMSKVHFTNSGSEANDLIVKLLRYRANGMGEPHRKKIISRLRGYHGVTLASASLTGLPNNHRSFDLPMEGILHTTCPHHWREAHEGESEEAFATRCADDLEAMIAAEGPETIAAFIAEPLMGAGGVVVPPATYWEKVQAVLRRHDILLVADEVICGFGRTGEMFGSTYYDMKPDIMTVSKALSSSYLPISAVLVNERVYGPIADESAKIGTFGHGFTTSGHPVAAAVALENLKIIEERDLVANARERGVRLQAGLRTLSDHPLVGEVRGVGLIAGVELVTDKKARIAVQPPGALAARAFGLIQERGVISRAIGDTLAFCPPLIIDDSQIDTIVETVRLGLDELAGEMGMGR
ncbi:aspartate aminotransferase family protein [Fulvimarina sp. 2208YS6-2-32]|uniref:Aspartate aminotransferase family protein n=1 Tax=Fulvimarina uroteuthidis TaxID=3098149 RepID=A0ABU5HXQ5_9HYPH|nr:aspartate aminotransferase family protein [Fulvimarina sp. 2208YS6-2-32]MDY8107575.1 aspartate aminotransferase family protein [Fulvimarina sp. 2208YS6-2-32]